MKQRAHVLRAMANNNTAAAHSLGMLRELASKRAHFFRPSYKAFEGFFSFAPIPREAGG